MKSQCFLLLTAVRSNKFVRVLRIIIYKLQDKEFQLKQQIQHIEMRLKSVDKYIKEFKGICDSLTATRNH